VNAFLENYAPHSSDEQMQDMNNHAKEMERNTMRTIEENSI